MNVKEKLVELLVEFIEVDVWDNGEFIEKDIDFQKIASNLIAHGATVQEWISVKDRLPENGKKVLVYCKENKNDYEIGAYSDTYRGFFVRQTCYENITHWMPLPQTPKGE